MNRASTLLFWVSVTLLISLSLFRTSYHADDLEHQLRQLNAQIEKEQRNIHVLKAEWNYLARPSRIARVAGEHLDLAPTQTDQFSSLRNLSSHLPTKREALAYAQKTGQDLYHPIAATPHMAANEADRLNHRLIIGKSSSYRMTNEEGYKISSIGGVP
ncbi:MAG: hypothetical protein AB7S81_08015 [Bdellovibrionales bacterium]